MAVLLLAFVFPPLESGTGLGRPFESSFLVSGGIERRPEDRKAIALVVQEAFEKWSRSPPLGLVETIPRIKVRDEPVAPSTILESRLAESFGQARESAEALLVEEIDFEGSDAWVTTSLRDASSATPARFRTLMVYRNEHWYAFLSEDPLAPEVTGEKYSTDPLLIENPSPNYPREAREKGIAGKVVLQVVAELEGSTTVLRVLKGLPYATVPAIETVWKWRWTPATKDGQAVRAFGTITLQF